ncbi:hypothetical protein MATL_G00233320 [Megalops atlanticus]|uniref:ENPP1-3/EXOG-like endonuclease/phosphodiesterase domain-containing protein n=1 Tax=Megalops atlanticus TaxID=7932 RepID=A0A9D3PE70_MEGAT|nr:hypothetical protein MATL_G00233320 [Megalops atlanticus]
MEATSCERMEILEDLCKKADQRVKPFLKAHLPKRFHYANSRRIEDVNVLVDPKWLFASYKGSLTFCEGGAHGYDNDVYSMQAMFLSYGPKFHYKTQVDPFSNVELYNLMCDVLEIFPAPNNGTHGSLNHLLRVPWHHPIFPAEQAPPRQCPLQSLNPSDPLGCSCLELENLNSLPAVVPDCLRADVRIPADSSPRCDQYSAARNITYGFLYPPNLNRTVDEQYDGLLMSNVVPMYPEFRKIWDYFHAVLLKKYAMQYNGINVLLGPVFDYNYDGHYDSPDQIGQYVGSSL